MTRCNQADLVMEGNGTILNHRSPILWFVVSRRASKFWWVMA